MRNARGGDGKVSLFKFSPVTRGHDAMNRMPAPVMPVMAPLGSSIMVSAVA